MSNPFSYLKTSEIVMLIESYLDVYTILKTMIFRRCVTTARSSRKISALVLVMHHSSIDTGMQLLKSVVFRSLLLCSLRRDVCAQPVPILASFGVALFLPPDPEGENHGCQRYGGS